VVQPGRLGGGGGRKQVSLGEHLFLLGFVAERGRREMRVFSPFWLKGGGIRM